MVNFEFNNIYSDLVVLERVIKCYTFSRSI